MYTVFIVLLDDIHVILNAKRVDTVFCFWFKAKQCVFESAQFVSSFLSILNAKIYR